MTGTRFGAHRVQAECRNFDLRLYHKGKSTHLTVRNMALSVVDISDVRLKRTQEISNQFRSWMDQFARVGTQKVPNLGTMPPPTRGTGG